MQASFVMRAEGGAIKRTAIHEAGHAVVARAVSHEVLRVSLADGVRTRYRRGDRHAHPCEAMVALGGPLAEQHYRPTTSAQWEALWRDEWHGDLDNARRRRGLRHGGTVGCPPGARPWCASIGRRSCAWPGRLPSAAR
jgi:hypothetical protein